MGGGDEDEFVESKFGATRLGDQGSLKNNPTSIWYDAISLTGYCIISKLISMLVISTDV